MSGNAELSFEDFVHEFNTHQNPASVIEGLKAEHRLDAQFHAPMVLLHDVVQVLTRADLDWILRPIIEFVAHAHPAEGRVTRFEAIQRDATRLSVSLESLSKESLGCSHISCTAEVRFHRTTNFIYGTVQIHPVAANLDIGLIAAPRPANRSLEWAPEPAEVFRIAHHPAQDRARCYQYPQLPRD